MTSGIFGMLRVIVALWKGILKLVETMFSNATLETPSTSWMLYVTGANDIRLFPRRANPNAGTRGKVQTTETSCIKYTLYKF